MITTKKDHVFNIINYLFLSIVGLCAVLPFVHIISKSLSNNEAVISGKVGLLPVGFTFETYNYVFFFTNYLKALKMSVTVTVIGTVLAIVIAAFTAYPLSRRNLKGRKFFLSLYIIDMYFSAGVVPLYLVVKALKLTNNMWSMILPLVVIPFYMFVIKSYYESIPETLEEAARIDGASNFKILTAIIMPIAKPVFATVALFYAVQYWNNFFNPMMYITKQNMEPLPIFLYNLIRQAESPEAMANADIASKLNPAVIRSAAIILSTIPILIVYPFLQRYFVKGMTIGSVKG